MEKIKHFSHCLPTLYQQPYPPLFFRLRVPRRYPHTHPCGDANASAFYYPCISETPDESPFSSKYRNVTFCLMTLHFGNSRQTLIYWGLAVCILPSHFAFLPPCYIPGVTPEGSALRLVSQPRAARCAQGRACSAYTPYAGGAPPSVRCAPAGCDWHGGACVSPGM